MSRVTLQTIADQIGVSRMTVSNAFSRPDQLSTELRDRILATADQLGYAGPDPAARVLARGATGAIGVLLTDSLAYAFADQLAAQFLGAIAGELEATGLALTLLTSSAPGDSVPARDVPMDGALVYSCDEQSPALSWLKKRRLPLVFVDQPPATRYSSVNVDDRGGARLAAQHLIDRGHRRIAVVTSSFAGPEGLIQGDPMAAAAGHTSHQRMLGWLDALRPAGIEPTVVMIRHGLGGEEGGRTGAQLVLGQADPPTAVLCFSDVTAYGVVQEAAANGFTVPGDLAVVGFDDIPLARRMHPSLTTVRQDATAKGQAAARLLVSAIARAGTDRPTRPRHLVLPTELVVRHSTAVS